MLIQTYNEKGTRYLWCRDKAKRQVARQTGCTLQSIPCALPLTVSVCIPIYAEELRKVKHCLYHICLTPREKRRKRETNCDQGGEMERRKTNRPQPLKLTRQHNSPPNRIMHSIGLSDIAIYLNIVLPIRKK